MSNSDREIFAASCSGMKYDKLADLLIDLDTQKDKAKNALAAIQSKIDTITIEVIPDKMAEDGFRSVNLAKGGSIRLSPQAFCSTKKGMKNGLFRWMKENQFRELITEVVNPSTLKAFISEQLKAGNPVPGEEIINYQTYTRASLVGVKNR